MAARVAVVGGGIVGLATALQLGERGFRVVVYENRSDFGAGATAAAIGGITPQSEAYCRGPLRYVATWSTNMYPEFLEAIAERSGRHIHVLSTGQLQVALSDSEMIRITDELVPVWISEGFSTIVLDRAETLEREPSLSESVVGSVLLPIEIAVDPPEIALSLVEALRTLDHVALVSNAGVVSIGANGAIYFEQAGVAEFDHIVVTAGLGSRELVPELARGVYPMRGQGVEFQTGCDSYALRHHVYAANGGPRRSAYMVPRADGRVAAGVTYEPNVDDDRADPEAIRAIVDGLFEVCPAVRGWTQLRTWSGVRPASVDGIPFIGPVSERVVVCAGHQGLGITLAPISGYLVAELIEKGSAAVGEREGRALRICDPARLQGAS